MATSEHKNLWKYKSVNHGYREAWEYDDNWNHVWVEHIYGNNNKTQQVDSTTQPNRRERSHAMKCMWDLVFHNVECTNAVKFCKEDNYIIYHT